MALSRPLVQENDDDIDICTMDEHMTMRVVINMMSVVLITIPPIPPSIPKIPIYLKIFLGI